MSSLVGVSPLITDWMKLGLKWSYGWQPVTRPFTLPAGKEVQLPSQNYTFYAPEGILLTFFSFFDHPKCGIRLEAYPNLDTENFFSIQNLLTNINQSSFLTTITPPKTPYGLYIIGNVKEWSWLTWMRLYLFNSDSVDHKCLTYAYTIATLQEPRPKDSVIPLQTIEMIRLFHDMYPEKRNEIKDKLSDLVNEYLKTLKPEVLGKEGA